MSTSTPVYLYYANPVPGQAGTLINAQISGGTLTVAQLLGQIKTPTPSIRYGVVSAIPSQLSTLLTGATDLIAGFISNVAYATDPLRSSFVLKPVNSYRAQLDGNPSVQVELQYLPKDDGTYGDATLTYAKLVTAFAAAFNAIDVKYAPVLALPYVYGIADINDPKHTVLTDSLYKFMPGSATYTFGKTTTYIVDFTKFGYQIVTAGFFSSGSPVTVDQLLALKPVVASLSSTPYKEAAIFIDDNTVNDTNVMAKRLAPGTIAAGGAYIVYCVNHYLIVAPAAVVTAKQTEQVYDYYSLTQRTPTALIAAFDAAFASELTNNGGLTSYEITPYDSPDQLGTFPQTVNAAAGKYLLGKVTPFTIHYPFPGYASTLVIRGDSNSTVEQYLKETDFDALTTTITSQNMSVLYTDAPPDATVPGTGVLISPATILKDVVPAAGNNLYLKSLPFTPIEITLESGVGGVRGLKKRDTIGSQTSSTAKVYRTRIPDGLAYSEVLLLAMKFFGVAPTGTTTFGLYSNTPTNQTTRYYDTDVAAQVLVSGAPQLQQMILRPQIHGLLTYTNTVPTVQAQVAVDLATGLTVDDQIASLVAGLPTVAPGATGAVFALAVDSVYVLRSFLPTDTTTKTPTGATLAPLEGWQLVGAQVSPNFNLTLDQTLANTFELETDLGKSDALGLLSINLTGQQFVDRATYEFPELLTARRDFGCCKHGCKSWSDCGECKLVVCPPPVFSVGTRDITKDPSMVLFDLTAAPTSAHVATTVTVFVSTSDSAKIFGPDPVKASDPLYTPLVRDFPKIFTANDIVQYTAGIMGLPTVAGDTYVLVDVNDPKQGTISPVDTFGCFAHRFGSGMFQGKLVGCTSVTVRALLGAQQVQQSVPNLITVGQLMVILARFFSIGDSVALRPVDRCLPLDARLVDVILPVGTPDWALTVETVATTTRVPVSVTYHGQTHTIHVEAGSTIRHLLEEAKIGGAIRVVQDNDGAPAGADDQIAMFTAPYCFTVSDVTGTTEIKVCYRGDKRKIPVLAGVTGEQILEYARAEFDIDSPCKSLKLYDSRGRRVRGSVVPDLSKCKSFEIEGGGKDKRRRSRKGKHHGAKLIVAGALVVVAAVGISVLMA